MPIKSSPILEPSALDSPAGFEALLGLAPRRPLLNLNAIGPSGRPVLIYGAGVMAAQIHAFLRSRGLADLRLAVDAARRPGPPTLGGLEILTPREADAQLPAYDLVLGFEAAADSPWSYLEGKFARAEAVYEPLALYNIEALNPDFFRARFPAFQAVWRSLADSLSRASLTAFLQAKLTHEAAGLAPLVRKPQYFQADVLPWSDREAFFDGGAYDGDTIRDFLAAVGGRYEHIWAVEPDEINFRNLEKFAAEKGLENVTLIQAALAARPGRAPFSGETGGTIGALGAAGRGGGGREVRLESLDRLVGASRRLTWLVLDIEGAELEALKGAALTIRRDRPKLAVCAYHRADDLVALPALIRELVPDYRLYFRLHLPRLADAVLYAVI